MLTYDTAETLAVLDAAAARLAKPRAALLEDLGTYLVSHPNVDSLRRLLRFGGETFVEFLHSLDELHDRARLAVPDLDMPVLEIADQGGGCFTLAVASPRRASAMSSSGILRAMADEYGALVFLEHRGGGEGCETVAIEVIETRFRRRPGLCAGAPA
jgi:hypothetical protein